MGWGGGRACSYIKNVRRNRLECRFGAEYRGKNPVLFTGFFPRGTGYFPRFPGFFPREKSGEFEGKIRCYHLRNRPRGHRVPNRGCAYFYQTARFTALGDRRPRDVPGLQSVRKPRAATEETSALRRRRRRLHAMAITQIHTSEESPRIMARRRGRRARRHAPRTPRVEGGANAAAPAESANTTTSLGAALNAGTRTVTREDGNSDNAIPRSGPQRLRFRLA